MKHYRLKKRDHFTSPALLFEVKIDLQDVRSGYRNSDWALFRAEWLDERDLLWTCDMVERLEKASLEEIDPPSAIDWPELCDEKMIQYLVHYYRPQIWRNYALGLYSFPAENRNDFRRRCEDLLLEERGQEFRRYREMCLHRAVALEQRMLQEIEEADWDDTWKIRRLTQVRNVFSDVREDMSRYFVRDNYDPLNSGDLDWKVESDPAFQDRLDDLRHEFISKYNEMTNRYVERARDIDVYEVPLNHSQLEILSRGILWNRVSKPGRVTQPELRP
ncbi:MAG: hypothetical protein ACRD1R_17245 [Acidobacteriota bacterium]